MKKALLLLLFLTTTGLHAQVNEDKALAIPYGNDFFMPAEYSADGRTHLVSTTWGNDHGEVISSSLVNVYDNDLRIVKSFNVTNITSLDPCNYNTGLSYGDLHILVTQTLFNNDDTYEYISCMENSEDETIGFNIVTEKGEILQSVLFGDGKSGDIRSLATINEKLYIRCYVDDYLLLYPINRSSTSGIKPLGEPVKLKANPTLVGRGEHITLELGGSGRGEKQVSVHDAAGRTVYSTTVPAGQSSTQINASELSQGLNVISVKGQTGRSKSCKVIVK